VTSPSVEELDEGDRTTYLADGAAEDLIVVHFESST
jgi:hypothetical protein